MDEGAAAERDSDFGSWQVNRERKATKAGRMPGLRPLFVGFVLFVVYSGLMNTFRNSTRVL